MAACNNAQALRRVLCHMDGTTLAKAERVNRSWWLVISDASWRWRLLCILEIPEDLRFHMNDAGGDWRHIYFVWQPALSLVRHHPYYLDLELDHNAEFLQTLRKDLVCRKLLDVAETRLNMLKQRVTQLKGLAKLCCSAADRATQLCQLQQKLKQEPADVPLQHQVERRQRQLHECLACSGCGILFVGSKTDHFTGPLVFDVCHHAVCTKCCHLPECPKCGQFIDTVPPEGDPEVARWAKRFVDASLKEQRPREFPKLSGGSWYTAHRAPRPRPGLKNQQKTKKNKEQIQKHFGFFKGF